ncbi:ATP-binding cassette domain-containing protein [Nonomuraea glycinis]|uniref:ABC transporter n=1 Tax=Nonomuraea glycinis TaxID=2047744 RepID=A0A918E962_9ACTN|nr:ABC-F family ATP-binding cassette domain-containing protein [Nonomuraea glycinis]MCA2182518.1 ATP-binding cassette domain-containing protein [Nonomuraea glycinis]GGP16335.1 ABC transporter [Nonomuraea glycinis]
MSYSIVCDALSFEWTDGTPVLTDLDVAFGPGRTGLMGVNGSGKSTLLRLIAGDLRPASGSISVAGEIGHLPQNLPLATGRTVADLLGIAERRAALHAIESGDVAEEHFTVLGDDWDIEERSRAELDRLGLDHVGLDRTAGTLSGGEIVMVGLAALLVRRPDVLLLDEPTNNLDLEARRRLYAAVRSWTGVLVVVSHDRALLDLVDQIADLREGGVRTFGGNLSAYEEMLAAEQEAAERTVRTAESDLKRQKRELEEARIKLDRRVRYGNKMYATKREPKIIMQERKRQAQVSAGKHRTMHADRLEQAQERLTEAELAVRDDAEIRVTLPETEVPAGRTVLTLSGVRDLYELRGGPDSAAEDGEPVEELTLRGPERVALIGPNGSGKTTLLKAIVESATSNPVTGLTDEVRLSSGLLAGGEKIAVGGPLAGAEQIAVGVPMRYLPQRLDLLDDSLSVLDNVRRFAPSTPINEVRARLARFLFRGAKVDQAAATLSGGERFRAVLAALLSAEPPPQLLLLDEPTNNLDMASVRQLSQALSAYQGALLLVSHDLPFLETLGITRWLTKTR